jgi:general secretion pathway protein D
MKRAHPSSGAEVTAAVDSWGRTGRFCRSLVGGLALALLLAPPVEAQDDDDSPRPLRPMPAGLRPGLPFRPGELPVPIAPPGARDDDNHDDSDDDSDDEVQESSPTSRQSKDDDNGSSGSGSSSGRTVSGSGDGSGDRQKPPILGPNAKVTIDFQDTPILELVKYFADITGRNFILTDDLKGAVTIISHHPVTVAEAYEAFLSALEVKGYTTVTVGKITKVIQMSKAAQAPLRVYEGDAIPYTDNAVTQVFQLQNVSVSDVSTVIQQLAGPNAKFTTYLPTNTLIITDAAVNIRRMWKIVKQLDVASPTSTIQVVPIIYANASDLQQIIEQLYGVDNAASTSSSRSSKTDDTRPSRRRRRSKDKDENTQASGTSAGSEGRYISKIITDERTNSLIIQANDEAIDDILALIHRLDVDVDPASRAQIHVVYLEHAKAEDVSQVLSNLTQDNSSSSSSRNRSTPRGPDRNSGRSNTRGRDERSPNSPASATAIFDDGVKVTSDENTNSLVIVASPESFAVIKSVIDKLDIRRKQVFVECVILELGSEDTFDLGIGYHLGSYDDASGTLGYASSQTNGNSLLLSTQDLLSGLALGVLGEAISVETEAGTISIPAFGIALNALQANSQIDILSTPNILTLDNEEAQIVVGRSIPFPVSSGLDANGQQLISYQREDVAITLKVTPQINESDFVTLEIFQEVSEVEEDSQGLDPSQSGFITSKRTAETTVMVANNQTIVIGGLMGHTNTTVETKVPILGDLPLIGVLFRGRREISRKTNLLIFLTPHVINEPADLEEIYRIKMLQRQEFVRRFYGKTTEEQSAELNSLLRYSMNLVDEPSVYRVRVGEQNKYSVIGTIDESGTGGVRAGNLFDEEFDEVEPDPVPAPEPPSPDMAPEEAE